MLHVTRTQTHIHSVYNSFGVKWFKYTYSFNFLKMGIYSYHSIVVVVVVVFVVARVLFLHILFRSENILLFLRLLRGRQSEWASRIDNVCTSNGSAS